MTWSHFGTYRFKYTQLKFDSDQADLAWFGY